MKEINLTQNKITLVDDEDFKYLNQYHWHTRKMGNTFYAGRNIKTEKGQRIILMHREILNILESIQEGDHIDGDGLNNVKLNLRVCSHKENSRNKRSRKNSSSNYLGVAFYKPKPWKAQIRVDNKLINLGSFNTEIEAAMVYDEAAKKYFGEFANLNFKKL